MKLLVVIGLAAVALAGCGGGSSYGGGSSSNSSNAAAASTSSGQTVYTFARDTMGKSNCTGACAQNWPPAGSAPGLDKAKLTTIKRPDGTTQVAFGGRPLYHFAGDTQPGDAKGDGVNAFGGLWHAVGTHAAAKPSSKPSSTRSYGY